MLGAGIANWETVAGVLLILAVFCYQVWLVRAVLFTRREERRPIYTAPFHACDFLPCDRHDCDFGLLWETQKDVLALLDGAGEEGVAIQDLAEEYRRLGMRYPELCEGIPFLDWLRWMQEAQLISCDEGRATIAEMGRFVLYDLDRNHAFAEHRCA